MSDEPEFDVAEAEDRLDDLEDSIEEVEERAREDLTTGGEGRTFADEGVREQVERFGDTRHPPADGVGGP